MTQDEIDLIFNLTITIHEDKWFGENGKRRDRNEIQEWVAIRLANMLNIYTIPCGMGWGILTTKEHFDEYWNENGKIDK